MALTPPDEFVAARNALAKQLKTNGDADTSKAVAAMRRGSWTDWALNAVADADAEMVRRYVEAASRVRSIQAGSKGDLRDALRDLRQLTTDLTRAASQQLTGRKHTPDLLELAERLSVVAGSDDASERLLAATLGGDVAGETGADGDDQADEVFTPSPKRPASGKPSPKPASEPKPTTRPPTPQPPADELHQKRLERAVADAQRAVDDAGSELEQADVELEAAVAGVESAAAAVERANAELSNARRAQIDAKRQRGSARRDSVAATRALERATAALEKG